jgi:hypothetical protein
MGFIQLYRFRSKRVSLILDVFLSTCSCDEDATSLPLSTPASSVPTLSSTANLGGISISTPFSELRYVCSFELTIFQSLTVLVKRLRCISLLWHLTWQADFGVSPKPRFVKFVSDSTVASLKSHDCPSSNATFIRKCQKSELKLSTTSANHITLSPEERVRFLQLFNQRLYYSPSIQPKVCPPCPQG